jgi:hypothetical protein
VLCTHAQLCSYIHQHQQPARPVSVMVGEGNVPAAAPMFSSAANTAMARKRLIVTIGPKDLHPPPKRHQHEGAQQVGVPNGDDEPSTSMSGDDDADGEEDEQPQVSKEATAVASGFAAGGGAAQLPVGTGSTPASAPPTATPTTTTTTYSTPRIGGRDARPATGMLGGSAALPQQDQVGQGQSTRQPTLSTSRTPPVLASQSGQQPPAAAAATSNPVVGQSGIQEGGAGSTKGSRLQDQQGTGIGRKAAQLPQQDQVGQGQSTRQPTLSTSHTPPLLASQPGQLPVLQGTITPAAEVAQQRQAAPEAGGGVDDETDDETEVSDGSFREPSKANCPCDAALQLCTRHRVPAISRHVGVMRLCCAQVKLSEPKYNALVKLATVSLLSELSNAYKAFTSVDECIILLSDHAIMSPALVLRQNLMIKEGTYQEALDTVELKVRCTASDSYVICACISTLYGTASDSSVLCSSMGTLDVHSWLSGSAGSTGDWRCHGCMQVMAGLDMLLETERLDSKQQVYELYFAVQQLLGR